MNELWNNEYLGGGTHFINACYNYSVELNQACVIQEIHVIKKNTKPFDS